MFERILQVFENLLLSSQLKEESKAFSSQIYNRFMFKLNSTEHNLKAYMARVLFKHCKKTLGRIT